MTPPARAAAVAGSPPVQPPVQPPVRAFFDAIVLVYAHDASEPRKRDAARELIFEHLGAGALRTSTQALAEYFSVVTSKGEAPLSARAAAWLIEQLPADAVVAPGFGTLRAAVRRCVSGDLSIWDALIVEAAREAGAEVLYTEDARLLRAVNGEPDDGPSLGGGAARGADQRSLRAVDPFAGSAARRRLPDGA